MRLFAVLSIFMLWALLSRSYYFCYVRGDCHHIPLFDSDSSHLARRTQDLELRAGDSLILSQVQQFYFDFASTTPILTENNQEYLAQAAKYWAEFPDQGQIHITGYYLEKEAQSLGDRHQDLGIDRAKSIAALLQTQYQIPSAKIFTKSESLNKDTLRQPIKIEIIGTRFALVERDSQFLTQIQNSFEQVTYSDLSANFDSGSKTFKPGPDFKIYVDSLRLYFERNPQDALRITGHTDSKGDAKYNQTLGLQRAEAVRDYLKNQGIRVRIELKSLGKTQLLAVDTLADGSFDQERMARNRRVELEILKSTRTRNPR